MNSNKNLTFKQYKIMDIFIITLLACVFEIIIVFASNKWFKARPFSISITTTIFALIMMRWNGWGAITALLMGVAYSVPLCLLLANGLMLQTCLIYSVGNCFSVLVLVLFKIIGKQKIRDSVFFSAMYVVLIYLLIHLGHSIVSICFFSGGLKVFNNFFVSDSISLLFALVAILVLRRLDGMFEDQKTYLLRVYKKGQEQKNS